MESPPLNERQVGNSGKDSACSINSRLIKRQEYRRVPTRSAEIAADIHEATRRS